MLNRMLRLLLKRQEKRLLNRSRLKRLLHLKLLRIKQRLLLKLPLLPMMKRQPLRKLKMSRDLRTIKQLMMLLSRLMLNKSRLTKQPRTLLEKLHLMLTSTWTVRNGPPTCQITTLRRRLTFKLEEMIRKKRLLPLKWHCNPSLMPLNQLPSFKRKKRLTRSTITPRKHEKLVLTYYI